MRKIIRIAALLLFAVGFSLLALRPAVAQGRSLLDAGIAYNYARSNAPAGGCGCFSLNGGSGWVALNFTRSIGIVGEIASQHASGISSTGTDLTLTSFLVGPRYTLVRPGRIAPFVQVLLGGAHAAGTLLPGSIGQSGSANAFALTAGGGLDISLSRHIALRAFEADYYLTHFDNGANGRQNNLRIAAGVMFRFGGTK